MPSMPNSSTPTDPNGPAAAAPIGLPPSTAHAPPELPPAIVGWRWAPVWVLAYVALLFAPGIAETALSLGAITMLVKLVLARFNTGARLLSDPAWALTSVLFAAYWLPELISSIDAVDPGRALREAAVDLRYLPFLWLVAAAVASKEGRRTTFGGLAIIISIWTADALLQGISGTSPLFFLIDALKHALNGHSTCSEAEIASVDRLGGILGPCNLKLGQVIASFSPFVLYAAARRYGVGGWLAASAAVGIVVVLAGSRASWITFALVLLLSGWRLLGWKRLLALFASGLLALVVLNFTSTQVHDRLQRTSHIVSTDLIGVDTALSGRTRIWRAALCMVAEHPINGVGARGFREAFPACDPQPGVVTSWGYGPALHAHQLILEVLSETGAFGLLMWLAGAALAWRAWTFADGAARERARPAMLALLVTVFPFNTHLAFYSTFWGGLTLLLAALYAGSLLAQPPLDGTRVDSR
ncbi:O-antigen ligase family protein [Lysobacter gummosus]|nr:MULTISPECIES: O-antigen ligase [Lysobacter]UJB18282.1 O-antigen ligase family protein [Lysobacter capsici]UJQ27994.1 O-antigen ligase family protein [Lysobacter gummosus]